MALAGDPELGNFAYNGRAPPLRRGLCPGRLAGRGDAENRPAGRIINLTSGQGLGPMPGELAYVATKGAINAFTVTLAAEVGPHNITVNAVDPGPTQTGWITPGFAAELLPRVPLGRLGEPADIARLVAFLASDDGGWITGQVIHSTGGFG